MRPPVQAPARSPVMGNTQQLQQRLNYSSNNSVSPPEGSFAMADYPHTHKTPILGKKAKVSPKHQLSGATGRKTFSISSTIESDSSPVTSGVLQPQAVGLSGMTSRAIRIVSAPPDVDFDDTGTHAIIKTSPLKTSPIKTPTHVVTSPSSSSHHVVMSREELEKHLDMKTSAKTQFMSLEKTPHILPENIFNDNSNSW